MSKANEIQMVYIEKLFDEKLAVVDEKLKRIEDKLDGSLKNHLKLEEKVERHDKWIGEFTAKMTLISAILGSVFALFFSVVKDVITSVLKIKQL